MFVCTELLTPHREGSLSAEVNIYTHELYPAFLSEIAPDPGDPNNLSYSHHRPLSKITLIISNNSCPDPEHLLNSSEPGNIKSQVASLV